mmetsp:Transcript_15429/g.22602  ORF Transcript_15429/g.22602 Transcript_15429/m.22602 type:complete len:157 (-) Transcript_15429:158-628(-)
MTWKKFTAYNSSPTVATYPELPENITILRLFLGLAYGISLGFRESSNDVTLKGAMGVIFGLNVITFLPIIYMNFYLNAATDTYKHLNFAGVQNALAVMMLLWIICFTMIHEGMENELKSALVKGMVNATMGGAGGDGAVGGDDVVAEVPVMQESEF